MTVLELHIALGSLGLLSGFITLVTRKGQSVHRTAGLGFLLFMGASLCVGIYVAVLIPERLTAISGTYALYLMFSGWLAIKDKPGAGAHINILLTLIGILVSAIALYFGVQAMLNATGMVDGFVTEQYLFFSALALISAISDVRWIVRPTLERRTRLIRHVCRMCVGMLIVAAAVFLGQPEAFPGAIQHTGLLTLPFILIVIVLFFWLFQLRCGTEAKIPKPRKSHSQ